MGTAASWEVEYAREDCPSTILERDSCEGRMEKGEMEGGRCKCTVRD